MTRLRLVSLLPSATEIVVALGAHDQLVARSHECDFPATVRALPAITRTRIDPAVPSGAITASVRSTLEAGLSLYAVDVDALRALAPDVILTQTLCAACAIAPGDLAAALAEWTGGRPQIVELKADRIERIYSEIVQVAALLRRPLAGDALVTSIAARLARVGARVARPSAPRAAAIEWLDPPMIGGNWLPELIEIAGGTPVLAKAGTHSSWLADGALAAADPDLLLLLPCGFDLARTKAEAPAFLARPDIAGLRAVRAGEVYALDGNAYFNRPGPRLADSVEILAEILHPTAQPPRHAGEAWCRLGA
ncbi:MAG: ABC transporter substrate-binding protein [Alphaproteobacteria bacterium]|nr:ABC transporter substrate-binding protein [Alphaproteobacteria bacterium]